jgi:SWI/SNF-related matrix-associated actin-dependent regulator of chromatin subfamily A protein 2/4
MPIIRLHTLRNHQILAERRKKKRHQDFLLQVINHQKEFHEYHRNNRTKIIRSNKALIAYYSNTEARQKREQERLEKERMRRLMAEDEEGYR